ncbi:MAG: EAL domain-containing protein [Rubrivivax sp.]|nr:EAL domain-containing protein [Rubrivivax sp.]
MVSDNTPWREFRQRHLHDYNDAAAQHWGRVVAAGALALGCASAELSQLGAADAWQLAGWTLLVLVAAAFPIHFPRSKLSFAAGDFLIFLVLALYGPAAAVMCAAAEGALGAWRMSTRVSSRIVTPAGAAAAMLLAGTFFQAFKAEAGDALPAAAAELAALAGAALIYLVAGSAPLMRVLCLKSGRPLRWRDWLASSSWVGAMYLAAAALAGMLSLQEQQHGRAMIVVAVAMLGLSLAWLRAHFRQQAAEAAAQDARVRTAEQESAQNQKRFHSAFTQASIGMAIVGADGRVSQVNQSLCRLIGAGEMQLLGQPFARLLNAGDAALLQRHVDAVLAAREEAFSIELRCLGVERQEIWVSLHCAQFDDPQPHADGAAPGLIFQVHDITSRRRAEGELHHIAYHDSLTDLANRNCFQERLQVAVEHSRTDRRYRFALMVLDLDRFKIVNDTLGHPAGDELLKEVARRLAACVRPPDLVARLGGDEFAILVEQSGDGEAVLRLSQRLQAALEKPVTINGTELCTAASLGVTYSDMGYRLPDEMLRDADVAMYRAKADGKGRLAIFDISMREQIGQKLQLETDLRRAIGDGQLSLAFQPLYRLDPHRLDGFEALARWTHPQRGVISPGVFIALAEETGCIDSLTAWAVDEAVRQLAAWRAAHQGCGDLVMHVNVSGKDLARAPFVPHVGRVLQRHGLPAGRLVLEITESTLMEHRELAMRSIDALVAQGVKIGIDDFGTGYSSLAYLSTLPFDCLKIDRSFVIGMQKSAKNLEIVRTVISLGRSLGKQVVAEGIETHEQLAQLRTLGATIGQGYLLGRPLSATQVRELLTEPLVAPA